MANIPLQSSFSLSARSFVKNPVTFANNASSAAEKSSTFTKSKNANILSDLKRERVVFKPGDCYDDVVGHEKAIMTIRKSFEYKFAMKNTLVSKKAGINAILLVGLPGTGKSTILGCAAAKLANFLNTSISVFNVSAATMISKWSGESENSLEVLYGLAEEFGPSVVNLDEVDGLMRARSENEDEHSRRFKTTFLSVLQGTRFYENVFTIACTNRGYELDAAFLRRFQKCFLLPSPNGTQRLLILEKALNDELGIKYRGLNLDESKLIECTDGFTGDQIVRAVKSVGQALMRYSQNGIFLTDKEAVTIKGDQITAVMVPLSWDILKEELSAVMSSTNSDEIKKNDTWARKYNVESSCFEDDVEKTADDSCQCNFQFLVNCICCAWCSAM